jgi:hypothetical protein
MAARLYGMARRAEQIQMNHRSGASLSLWKPRARTGNRTQLRRGDPEFESPSLQCGVCPHRAMERLGDEEYPVGPRRSYTSRPAPIALPQQVHQRPEANAACALRRRSQEQRRRRRHPKRRRMVAGLGFPPVGRRVTRAPQASPASASCGLLLGRAVGERYRVLGERDRRFESLSLQRRVSSKLGSDTSGMEASGAG